MRFARHGRGERGREKEIGKKSEAKEERIFQRIGYSFSGVHLGGLSTSLPVSSVMN